MPLRVLNQDLLVTLFGLFGHLGRDSGLVPVSGLVAWFAAVGVDGAAARSTLSRLKRNGVLRREVIRGAPHYALAPDVIDAFEADDARIFAPVRSTIDDPWALVVFSVPETKRERRFELRRVLAGLGFGFVASGVAIAPHAALEHALERLAELDLTQYVQHFSTTPGASADLRERITEWWDLDELDDSYGQFIEDFESVAGAWRTRLSAPGRVLDDVRAAAFADYVVLLTRWRRFPFADPNIPLDLLPVGWKAPRAKMLFFELHAMLHDLASDHARALLERGA